MVVWKKYLSAAKTCIDFIINNLFEDEKQQLDIELEFPYQSSKGSKKFIDILARYGAIIAAFVALGLVSRRFMGRV